MSLFFIKLQKQSLKKALHKIKEDGATIDASMLGRCDNSYLMYSTKTKSWHGWAKSLVPFTYEYKVRRICAERFNEINSSIKKYYIRPKENTNPLKSHSDSDLYIKQRHFKPVSSKKSDKQSTLNINSTLKQRK